MSAYGWCLESVIMCSLLLLSSCMTKTGALNETLEIGVIGDGHVSYKDCRYRLLKLPGCSYVSPLTGSDLMDTFPRFNSSSKVVIGVEHDVPTSELFAIGSALKEMGLSNQVLRIEPTPICRNHSKTYFMRSMFQARPLTDSVSEWRRLLTGLAACDNQETVCSLVGQLQETMDRSAAMGTYRKLVGADGLFRCEIATRKDVESALGEPKVLLFGDLLCAYVIRTATPDHYLAFVAYNEGVMENVQILKGDLSASGIGLKSLGGVFDSIPQEANCSDF